MNSPIELTPGNTVAIVVGIEEYSKLGKINELDGAANDAICFSDWLLKKGVPVTNIKMFLSPLKKNQQNINEKLKTINEELSFNQANQYNIINKTIIDWLPKTKASIFFFFWSGHGVMTKPDWKKRNFLIFENASKQLIESFPLTHFMNFLKTTEWFKNIKRQIFFIDSCRRYLDKMGVKGEPTYYKFRIDEENEYSDIKNYCIFAAQQGDIAIQKNGSGHFSHVLLNHLKDKGITQLLRGDEMDKVAQNVKAALKDTIYAQRPTVDLYNWDGEIREDSVLSRVQERDISSSSKLYLMIRITESVWIPGRYSIDARWYNGRTIIYQKSGKSMETIKEQCIKEGRINALKLLDDSKKKNFYVEFFLPRELIMKDVDQWEVSTESGFMKIGKMHQVWIRSNERSSRQKTDPHFFLKDRWEMLCQCSEKIKICDSISEDSQAIWVSGSIDEIGDFRSSLNVSPKIVCALLTEEPQECNFEKGNDFLNSVLAFGIPIVIWIRNHTCDNREDVKLKLKSIVEDSHAMDIPEKIFEIRKNSHKENSNFRIGDNITLLCDNPTRLFPDIKETIKYRLHEIIDRKRRS
jgi:hypothetical protein